MDVSDTTAPLRTAAAARRPLDHLALLTVRGADARTFLDGQLTQTVPPTAKGGVGVASPAGYCSPKGRLLANFVVWSADDAIHLLVSSDLCDAIVRRLRMYVLRAKATIDAVPTAIVAGFGPFPEAAPWQVAVATDATSIEWPDRDGRSRRLVVTTVEDASSSGSAAAERAVDWPSDALSGAAWRWHDVRAGLPRIVAATQDRFVPQMLNLEALGGVDFRKGCYPGQEVVARSQYLGKLKRRTALATTIDGGLAPPLPGSDVWTRDGREPRGLVVNAEAAPDGRVALLVELPVDLFLSSDLRLGTTDGPPLALEPLPYALPDNEVFERPRL